MIVQKKKVAFILATVFLLAGTMRRLINRVPAADGASEAAYAAAGAG